MAPNPLTNPPGHDQPQSTSVPNARTAPVRAAEAQLHLRAADILEWIADAFVLLDAQWHIVYANHKACCINQKPLETFVGRIHWEEWPAAVGTPLVSRFRRAMTDRVDVHFVHRYVSDPYDVWLETDAYPIEGGLSLFYHDMSARKRAEEEREELLARC